MARERGWGGLNGLRWRLVWDHLTCSSPCSCTRAQNNDNFEEGLLKLVRTLPKVLKYLPSDKAQDAKNFVNSLQYWLGGNSENLENLLLNTVSNYVPALKGVDFSVADPTAYPDVGIWHPLASGMYEDLKEYLNW